MGKLLLILGFQSFQSFVLSLKIGGDSTPICSDMYPESAGTQTPCWSDCSLDLPNAECDWGAVDWKYELVVSDMRTTNALCSSGLKRFICIPAVTRLSQQLCELTSDGSMGPGDFCWTDCGQKCPDGKTRDGFIFETPQIKKINNCAKGYRRLCKIHKNAPVGTGRVMSLPGFGIPTARIESFSPDWITNPELFDYDPEIYEDYFHDLDLKEIEATREKLEKARKASMTKQEIELENAKKLAEEEETKKRIKLSTGKDLDAVEAAHDSKVYFVRPEGGSVDVDKLIAPDKSDEAFDPTIDTMKSEIKRSTQKKKAMQKLRNISPQERAERAAREKAEMDAETAQQWISRQRGETLAAAARELARTTLIMAKESSSLPPEEIGPMRASILSLAEHARLIQAQADFYSGTLHPVKVEPKPEGFFSKLLSLMLGSDNSKPVQEGETAHENNHENKHHEKDNKAHDDTEKNPHKENGKSHHDGSHDSGQKKADEEPKSNKKDKPRKESQTSFVALHSSSLKGDGHSTQSNQNDSKNKKDSSSTQKAHDGNHQDHKKEGSKKEGSKKGHEGHNHEGHEDHEGHSHEGHEDHEMHENDDKRNEGKVLEKGKEFYEHRFNPKTQKERLQTETTLERLNQLRTWEGIREASVGSIQRLSAAIEGVGYYIEALSPAARKAYTAAVAALEVVKEKGMQRDGTVRPKQVHKTEPINSDLNDGVFNSDEIDDDFLEDDGDDGVDDVKRLRVRSDSERTRAALATGKVTFKTVEQLVDEGSLPKSLLKDLSDAPSVDELKSLERRVQSQSIMRGEATSQDQIKLKIVKRNQPFGKKTKQVALMPTAEDDEDKSKHKGNESGDESHSKDHKDGDDDGHQKDDNTSKKGKHKDSEENKSSDGNERDKKASKEGGKSNGGNGGKVGEHEKSSSSSNDGSTVHIENQPKK